ncbi:MAG: amidohydrolase family protein [Victivallales bacterium]|nr:amidohydrolase family protein [Victivallales bacterium]
MHDLLISGGRVVDAAAGFDAVAELLVSAGKISACSSAVRKSSDAKVIDAAGKLVIPGLVDSHVHLDKIEGYYMLARAGVSSALDMAGYRNVISPNLETAQTGLNLAYLFPLIPERTVSGINPGGAELREVIEKALSENAFGIKIIGGHYPLTPEAERRTLEICAELSCYCAVHAGSTENGSNINGLAELVEIAGKLPLHIAHVNSYCRGQVTGNPVEEAGRALGLVRSLENVRSESYLDVINGTSGRIVDGVPLSNVTKNCLQARNYPQTAAGLEAAIHDGWAQVQGRRGREVVLLPPETGRQYFKDADSEVMLSFAVNSPGAAIAIACARDNRSGKFIVNALSTDGGCIPRNTTLAKALPLVRFGALTMLEMVEKACLAPAKMLNWNNKGHFSPGADADICIVDPESAEVEYLICGGKITYRHGRFFPVPGKLISR